MYMPTKKYLRKKAKILCIMVQIVIESESFDILKELLNPRECGRPLIFQTMNSVRL